ncbi:hypothetical protein DL767_008336 [Monosporascus sp. MG133]|nr:hypothetical protein DL767_008336 [Monosporascus sp. MG133]
MQYFNTRSWKPWAESTEHAAHLADPDMTPQIQSSAEADHTSAMIDHHEMDSTTDSIRTGFAGGRSHVKATELRENLVVKAFLEDLLDEKVHEFQRSLTNTAQRTEELFSIQDGHIQGLKNSQQETTTLVRALTQEIAELKSNRKRTADEISGNCTEEDTKSLTEEILRLKKHSFQVKKALEEKEKEHEAMRTSLDEALGEIEQLRSTDRTFTVVDDGAIVSQWKELKFLIHILARQRFNRPIKLPLPSPQHEDFGTVSEVYPDIVDMTSQIRGRHIMLYGQLAATFAQAKAEYRAYRGNEGSNVMFSDEWMETKGDKVADRPGIDLMITPALIKFGNSDGENYSEYTVLDKAEVF